MWLLHLLKTTPRLSFNSSLKLKIVTPVTVMSAMVRKALRFDEDWF